VVYWPTFGGRARGAAWYGAPMPLRWWFRARFGVWARVEGCGCVKMLKDAWLWVRR
jgi:hypothetical protein